MTTIETRIRLQILEWKKRIRAIASLAIRIARLIHAIVFSRIAFPEATLARLRASEVLLDRYYHQRDFSAEGAYKDPYAPGLVDWYHRKGISTAMLLHGYRISMRDVMKNYRHMRDSDTPMAPFERFLKFGDLLSAAFQLIAGLIAPVEKLPLLKGIQLNSLVAAEKVSSLLHNYIGLLYLRLPKSLAICGVRPRLILDWFENQSIDRGLALGMTEAPHTKLAGFRQYVLFPMCSSLYTTTSAVASGAAPAICFVSSRHMELQLRYFDSRTEFHVIPALRYSHLYQMVQSTEADSSFPRTILLLLTHSDEENFGILDNAIGAVLRMAESEPIRMLIKTHPNLSLHDTEKMIFTLWPTAKTMDLRVSDRPLSELFGQAQLAVSGGSSAAVESVCLGIPVIIVGREAGITMNPLEGLDSRLWRVTYGSEEMAEAIYHGWPDLPPAVSERKSIGHDLKTKLFEPYTETAMEPLAQPLLS